MRQLESSVESSQILAAQTLIREMQSRTFRNLSESEFKVFSQWGEDGIIQYLISKVPLVNEVFIEFGVSDYSESNTRFLMMNNNWRGLVIEQDKRKVERIRSSSYYWRHELTAICASVTAENINSIIRDHGIEGDIGILSIDIDGNDYWVWRAIEVVSPRIVIAEYNSLFGAHRAVTVPYQSDFSRTRAHPSNLYFGASLKALCGLAAEKGYVFVGSTKSGVNAFFVRTDVAANIRAVGCEEGYVLCRARESRDADGAPTFVSGEDRLGLISHMEVIDVDTGLTTTLREVLAT